MKTKCYVVQGEECYVVQCEETVLRRAACMHAFFLLRLREYGSEISETEAPNEHFDDFDD